MDNKQLEQKIKEIIAISNYFDMEQAIISFNKEYKKSQFYKNTHKALKSVVKEAKLHYLMDINSFKNYLQNLINELDISKLQDILSQLAETYATENQDIMEIVKDFKEIVG